MSKSTFDNLVNLSLGKPGKEGFTLRQLESLSEVCTQDLNTGKNEEALKLCDNVIKAIKEDPKSRKNRKFQMILARFYGYKCLAYVQMDELDKLDRPFKEMERIYDQYGGILANVESDMLDAYVYARCLIAKSDLSLAAEDLFKTERLLKESLEILNLIYELIVYEDESELFKSNVVTMRVVVLDKLVHLYYTSFDFDRTVEYASKLMKALPPYKEDEDAYIHFYRALAHDKMSLIYLWDNYPNKAKHEAMIALKFRKELNSEGPDQNENAKFDVSSYCAIAEAERRTENLDKALKTYKKAYKIQREVMKSYSDLMEKTKLYRIKVRVCEIYLFMGKTESQIKLAKSVLKDLKESLKDSGQDGILNGQLVDLYYEAIRFLGIGYHNAGQPKRALKVLDNWLAKTASYTAKNTDTASYTTLFSVYYHKAIALKELGRYEEALEEIKKAISLVRSIPKTEVTEDDVEALRMARKVLNDIVDNLPQTEEE